MPISHVRFLENSAQRSSALPCGGEVGDVSTAVGAAEVVFIECRVAAAKRKFGRRGGFEGPWAVRDYGLGVRAPNAVLL